MEWPILDRSSAQSSLEIIEKSQDHQQTNSKMTVLNTLQVKILKKAD